MKSVFGLAALLVAAGTQAPPDLMKIPVFFTVPGTEAVRVEREIVFRTAGDSMLKADIYLPAARGTYPVVLLVSGGSVNDWRTAAFYTSFARVLAAEGIAAVNYDKRLARDRNSVPAASDDSLALVEYLKNNAAKYGLDTSRLCTWHFSAGGTVAGTMLGEESPASCVVLTYAILSFGDGDQDARLAPHSALVQARERGDHGFEILNDTDETRRVIAQSIAWVKSRLKPS